MIYLNKIIILLLFFYKNYNLLFHFLFSAIYYKSMKDRFSVKCWIVSHIGKINLFRLSLWMLRILWNQWIQINYSCIYNFTYSFEVFYFWVNIFVCWKLVYVHILLKTLKMVFKIFSNDCPKLLFVCRTGFLPRPPLNISSYKKCYQF